LIVLRRYAILLAVSRFVMVLVFVAATQRTRDFTSVDQAAPC
jgi:hypothetical protein